MSATARALMTQVADPTHEGTSTKVSVIGAGAVGMACVLSILETRIIGEIAIVDQNENLVHGESLDIQHGSMFLGNPNIVWSSEYDVTANSKICVVTAGVRQREGESRLELVQRNTDIFKSIIPEVAQHSPDCILIIVTNPCDILAFVAMKLSGFPPNRVFASGTTLDSARFRYLISQKLNMAPESVHGWIIGEHGDSSVPVWSGVNVSGVRLADINPAIGSESDPEEWAAVHAAVVSGASDIIQLKGYTSWGIGLSIAKMCSVILRDSREVLPVSVLIKGCKHGVDKDVFLSLPCVLGSNGVIYIVKQALTRDEKEKLQHSANVMNEVQKGINL